MKRLTVRLDEATHVKLQVAAEAEKRTTNSLVAWIVTKWLKERDDER